MNGRRPAGGGPSTRVVLIEDHATVRHALAFVLNQEPDLEVVGQAGTLAEARQLSAEFDVALVDLGLPDGSGTEAIKDLLEINPRCTILVLTAETARAEFALAVESGACGILHKATALEEIPQAVRRIVAGETLISKDEIIGFLRLAAIEHEKNRRVHQAARQLTRREKEILHLLAEGLSDREIAERLHISFETERSHMTNILAKFGANSRLQALVYAARSGIVEFR